MNAPQRPWKKGIFSEYSCFSVKVDVCIDRDGNVFSARKPETEQDEAIVGQLVSRGMEETSLALQLEAVKQEVVLQVLLNLAHKSDFRQKMENGEIGSLVDSLKESVQAVLMEGIDKNIEQIIEDTLRYTQQGLQMG